MEDNGIKLMLGRIVVLSDEIYELELEKLETLIEHRRKKLDQRIAAKKAQLDSLNNTLKIIARERKDA